MKKGMMLLWFGLLIAAATVVSVWRMPMEETVTPRPKSVLVVTIERPPPVSNVTERRVIVMDEAVVLADPPPPIATARAN